MAKNNILYQKWADIFNNWISGSEKQCCGTNNDPETQTDLLTFTIRVPF